MNIADKTEQAAALGKKLQKSLAVAEIWPEAFDCGGPVKKMVHAVPVGRLGSRVLYRRARYLVRPDGERFPLGETTIDTVKDGTVIQVPAND